METPICYKLPNVWHQIVILTDISKGYESFGSIFTMIALSKYEWCPHTSQIIMTWSESSSWWRWPRTPWWHGQLSRSRTKTPATKHWKTLISTHSFKHPKKWWNRNIYLITFYTLKKITGWKIFFKKARFMCFFLNWLWHSENITGWNIEKKFT